MKKLYMSTLVFLLLVLVAGEGFAQQILTYLPSSKVPVKNYDNADLTEANNIQARARKNLARECAPVSGETWLAISDGYRAKFIKEEKAYEIFYDSVGRWRYTIKSYAAAHLQPVLHEMIKSSFESYKIMKVIEIENFESEGQPTYIIQL